VAKSLIERAGPSRNVPSKGYGETINGDSLHDESVKVPLLEDAASKAKYVGGGDFSGDSLHPDMSSEDESTAGEILDHLSKTGGRALALKFLKTLAGPVGLAFGLTADSTPTSKDDTLGSSKEESLANQAKLMEQTKAILNASATDNTEDSPVVAIVAPQKATEADIVVPTASDTKIASEVVEPSKAVVAARPISKASTVEAPTPILTDKQIHEWNLKNNPNYDSSLYNENKGVFVYTPSDNSGESDNG